MAARAFDECEELELRGHGIGGLDRAGDGHGCEDKPAVSSSLGCPDSVFCDEEGTLVRSGREFRR